MQKKYSQAVSAAVGIVLSFTLVSSTRSAAAPARPLTKKVKKTASTPVTAPAPAVAPVQKLKAPAVRFARPWVENDWYLFGGVDAGISSYSAFNSATENSRTGFHGGIRGLLAHYSHDWVVDGGIGWQFLQNSTTNPNNSTEKVVTRGGYLDLSPRYRMNRQWQLGPEFEYWLTTDNGLNPNVLQEGQSNNGFFGGVQVLYEWMGKSGASRKYRFGGRFLHGLNVDSRSVNVIQACFQVGFDVFDSKHEVEDTHNPEQVNESDIARAEPYPVSEPAMAEAVPAETPWSEPQVLSTPEPLPAETATPAPTPIPELNYKPVPQKRVVLTLDINDLPFEFDSAKLPLANQNRVKKIGAFLAKHEAMWKSLSVEGHTDERGSNAYNDKLSRSRANAVKDLLVAGGAPRSKVKAVGFGKRHPKIRQHNEKAWAQNRRVELVFHGVKDVKILHSSLKE